MLRNILTIQLVFLLFVVRSQSIGDSLHAVHYNIHLNEINIQDKTISGFTTVVLTPLSDGLTGISLELIDLNIDSVFINETAHDFTHTEGVVQINMAETISVGDTIETKIYYHGQPFRENWGGFHFAGDYAFNLGVGFVSIPHNLGKAWFPCIDDFTDRATYDLYATVENSKKAIGGGSLIETIDNGNGTTTWHWQLNHNIPTYLESVMVGDYVLSSDEYFGIEDTLPISIYSRPQDTSKVAGSFVNLKEITRFFEDHFGPYPFSRIGFTATASGAMEHATNISYPYSGFNGNTSLEWWYTHELSHMWFGDKVTCSTAEDMWLNEGWATFCQIFYLEGLYSLEDFKATMRDKHKEVLQKTHLIDNGYYALNNVPQEYTYGSTSYDKGATVVNALRTYLGDSVFYDAITAYLQNFAYQSASSFDMKDFLTSHTGIDMNGFFDTWVFTPGTPHYSIDSTKYSDGQLDIWLKQKFKGFDFIGNNHIVQIAYLKNNYDLIFDTAVFSGKTGHSIKQLDFLPLAVIVDPQEIMMDATIDKYLIFDSIQDYLFPNTYFKIFIDELQEEAFIQTTHNWVSPDSLKEALGNLKLSPSRYWKIEGHLPDGMQARGRFFYENSVELDAELITSQTDSVVLLFRENTADDWHSISQNREGIWRVGYIYIDELKMGEYTLAVHDVNVGLNETVVKKNFKIYPNPSKGKLNLDFDKEGEYFIKLIDPKGTTVDSLSFSAKKISWEPQLNNSGQTSYLLFIYNLGKLISVERIIFVK